MEPLRFLSCGRMQQIHATAKRILERTGVKTVDEIVTEAKGELLVRSQS